MDSKFKQTTKTYMTTTIKTVISIFAMAVVCACNNDQGTSNGASAPKQDTVANTTTEEHNAPTSLDWQGSYSGLLPCADCEGIETSLALYKDNTYVLSEVYSGKGDSTDHIASGKFTWQGNNVKLEGLNGKPSFYKVEEKQIRSLDMNGQPVEGQLADAYILSKDGNSQVEGKRWQLIELNGKKINGTAESHYIIFSPNDNKLIMKAGCNAIINNYKIKNDLQLKVTAGISTKMACADKTEEELMKALLMADNFTSDGASLTINKARMAPLARFKVIEN